MAMVLFEEVFVKNSKVRLVGILTVLLLFGFVTTSLVSYYVAHDALSEQIAETTLPLTSDNIYSEIQRDLLRPIFISSFISEKNTKILSPIGYPEEGQ